MRHSYQLLPITLIVQSKPCLGVMTLPMISKGCLKSIALGAYLTLKGYNYIAFVYSWYAICPSEFNGTYGCEIYSFYQFSAGFSSQYNMNPAERAAYILTFGSLLYEILIGNFVLLFVVCCTLRFYKCQPKRCFHCSYDETKIDQIERAIRPFYVFDLIFVIAFTPFANVAILPISLFLKFTAMIRIVFYCSVLALPATFLYQAKHSTLWQREHHRIYCNHFQHWISSVLHFLMLGHTH